MGDNGCVKCALLGHFSSAMSHLQILQCTLVQIVHLPESDHIMEPDAYWYQRVLKKIKNKKQSELLKQSLSVVSTTAPRCGSASHTAGAFCISWLDQTQRP